MKTPHIERVIKGTALHFEMPDEVIRDPKYRTPSVTYARHLAMYLCRKRTFASYAEVGKAFSLQHTSVIYGFKKIEGFLLNGKKATVKGDIDAIIKLLK